MKSTKATAKIQITVEVDAGAPWGPECTVEQLYKQAKDSGLSTLMNVLKDASHTVRIVGEPKVIGIYTETP